MRQGQNSKRSRGRGSGRRNVPPRHQTFDSNGPSVRIRGSAFQVHEKYLALARDAGSAGDRIAAENYFQHAEHYFRIINMDNDGDSQNRGRAQQNGSDGRGEHGRERPDGPDAAVDAGGEQADATAPAPDARVVQGNGADEQPVAGAGEQPVAGAGEQPDVEHGETDGAEAAQPAPKRKAGRGGKGRGTRAASRTSESDGNASPAGPNGADAGDQDVPTTED